MLIKNSEQNLFDPNFDCDQCGEVGSLNDKGYAFVAQGATGRYCEVMWICDSCGGDDAIDVETARKQCNADPRGYADF